MAPILLLLAPLALGFVVRLGTRRVVGLERVDRACSANHVRIAGGTLLVVAVIIATTA